MSQAKKTKTLTPEQAAAEAKETTKRDTLIAMAAGVIMRASIRLRRSGEIEEKLKPGRARLLVAKLDDESLEALAKLRFEETKPQTDTDAVVAALLREWAKS